MPVSQPLTLKEWLYNTVAFVLNDNEPGHEFTRYPLASVLSALNDGLAMVAKYRPDLFTELRIIKLSAGRHQDARGCCSQILDVLEQTDASGNIIKTLLPARKTSTTAKPKWTKPSCIIPQDAPGGYVIDYANIDANLNGRFEVFPPVPCDTDVYVRAKCVANPCRYTEADLNTPFDGGTVSALAVKHYIIAWMLFGDRYTNAASRDGNGAWHYNTFFTVLGVIQKAEDRIESPEQTNP